MRSTSGTSTLTMPKQPRLYVKLLKTSAPLIDKINRYFIVFAITEPRTTCNRGILVSNLKFIKYQCKSQIVLVVIPTNLIRKILNNILLSEEFTTLKSAAADLEV